MESKIEQSDNGVVKLGQMGDVNFPMDDAGRTFHIQCKRGEICNRIITVGSLDRGEILCSMLDKVLKIIRSKRGFVVFTGIYKDAYISIVVSQMGGPNMDFVVREVKAVVDGDIAIFRLGSCGAMHPSAPVGSLVISSKGSLFCSTNYDALYCGSNAELYKVSGPVLPDEELNSHILQTFKSSDFPSDEIFEGLNCSCDSYYSSQGRTDPLFDDKNETLVDDLCKKFPELLTLEMENFHLFHLAKLCKGTIKAAAASVPLANRSTLEFIDGPHAEKRMRMACKIALDAMASFKIPDDKVMPGAVFHLE